MISVIAKDKCLSAASVNCQQSFQQIQLRQAMKSGTLGTEYLRRYLCNSTRCSQLSNFSSMQSSFEMCLPLTNMPWKRKQRTSHSFVMRTPCGPRNCQLYLAVWWEGRLGYRMPSKDLDRACNIRWLQQSLPGPGLYNWRLNVRQWILCTIPRLASSIL